MPRDPELYLDDPEYYQDPYGPLDTTFEDEGMDWDHPSLEDEMLKQFYEEQAWAQYDAEAFNEDLEDD